VKIVVCIKEVPDTEAYIKIGADKKSIDESGISFIMNPYDEYAVEEALKIMEARGGETTAICLGTERANEVLRSAVAMGIEHSIRLKSDAAISDGLAAATLFADALRKMDFDIVLMGKETIDDGSMQIGPILGELLGLPCITLVTKLDIGDGKVTAERETESGTEIFEAPIPCILTAQKGLNEPRYPSLRGKMAAKKAVIEERDVAVPGSNVRIVSMEYPPRRGEGKVVGEGPEAVPELVRLLRDEAQVI
jgi:electron transfer flavoprotein beta subunit